MLWLLWLEGGTSRSSFVELQNLNRFCHPCKEYPWFWETTTNPTTQQSNSRQSPTANLQMGFRFWILGSGLQQDARSRPARTTLQAKSGGSHSRSQRFADRRVFEMNFFVEHFVVLYERSFNRWFFSMRLWSEISVVVFCFCLWIWASFTRPCVRTAHVARSIDQVCFSRLGTSTRGGYRGLRQEGPLPRRSQSVKFQLPVGTSAPPIALYFQETSKFSPCRFKKDLSKEAPLPPCRSTCHRTWTQGPNWDLAPIFATELAAQWWSWVTQMVMLSVKAFQVVVDIKHFLGAKFVGFQLKFFSQEQVSLNFERHPQVEYFWQVGDAEFCKQPGCRIWQTLWTSKDYGKTMHWHHIHILPNVQSQIPTSSLWAVHSMKCESSVKLWGGRCRSFRGLCSHEEREEWKNWKIPWHRKQNKAVLPGKFDVEM